MRICFLGICGTFMAGVALIARELGHQVVGMDRNVYPPMDGILAEAGIEIIQGYEASDLPPADTYIVGNALSRGAPAVERLLNDKLPYMSAPGWLARQVLRRRRVLAVAGTHGKTTTTALLAKMLQEDGRDIGYLIAGAAKDFSPPAHLGTSEEFVLEADEYDSAFFDKRSKFVHYRPDLLLINNLEYDHADIFPDLAAIESQFRHLLRTMPTKAQVLYPAGNQAILRCLQQEPHSEHHQILGVFPADADSAADASSEAGATATDSAAQSTEQASIGGADAGLGDAADADDAGGLAAGDAGAAMIKPKTTWQALRHNGTITLQRLGGEQFGGEQRDGARLGKEQQSIQLHWDYPGEHNAMNLLFAGAAAALAGAAPAAIASAAKNFRGVARRLETIGELKGAPIISDFAHHPTAIKASIAAVREQFPTAVPDPAAATAAGNQTLPESPSRKNIIAVIELASNSVLLGAHQDKLLPATAAADQVLWFCRRQLNWDADLKAKYGKIYTDADQLAAQLQQLANPDRVLLLMSNSSFGGLLDKLTNLGDKI